MFKILWENIGTFVNKLVLFREELTYIMLQYPVEINYHSKFQIRDRHYKNIKMVTESRKKGLYIQHHYDYDSMMPVVPYYSAEDLK